MFSGIERGSVVAVSNYGSYRDPEARFIFESGYKTLVSELRPEAIMFFGKVYPKVLEIAADRTKFVPFKHPTRGGSVENVNRAKVDEDETIF